MYRMLSFFRGQQTFSIKGQLNVLGHTVSVATTQLWYCISAVARDNVKGLRVAVFQ